MMKLSMIVLAGCVSTSMPSGGGAGEPAALVGSWYAGAGGLSAPYDPTTGTYGMPNGQGLVYTLRTDGTYTKAFQSYESANGCTTGFTAFENGSYTASATSLQTTPTDGTIQYRDTCAPSLNSDKPNTDLAVEQFSVSLAGDQLTLVRTDGVTGNFRRI